jgi:hypothetical protein
MYKHILSICRILYKNMSSLADMETYFMRLLKGDNLTFDQRESLSDSVRLYVYILLDLFFED